MLLAAGCSHTSTPVKKPTIPEVTLPSVYDEYETETNSEGEIVVIVPSTDENGSTEYITEIATDEAGENITVPPTTEEVPTEPETKPSTENQTTEPVTEPSGEDMTEAPTQKPTVKPTESNKETGTTKPTNAPTTEPQTTKPTQKPTQPPTTEPETTKPVVPPTTEPQTTVPPTTEAPTPTPTEPPTTAPVITDKLIKTTDSDYSKYNKTVKSWVEDGFEVYTTGEWAYQIHPRTGNLSLFQYLGNAKTVTVPISMNGQPVYSLNGTFEDNTTVENVIVPANNSIATFLDTFNNANIKTVKIGHQGALISSLACTFDFANGVSYTADKTVYVYLDEDFVAKAWKDSSHRITAYCNCTFVVSMKNGTTAYYHLYYNDCNHEYHLYE